MQKSHVVQSNRKQELLLVAIQQCCIVVKSCIEKYLISIKGIVFLSKDDALSIYYTNISDLALSLDFAHLIDKYTQSASNNAAVKPE
nr:AlNc14C362G11004 [Albugo laibachii Nc14]|eukprot:CCA26265.1 AlNc14C362G11004 [Albugo laibachii Nc14]